MRLAVTRSDWPGDFESTLSSAFRHTGWATVRSRVYASLRRTVQSVSRIVNFSACGDRVHVLRSDDDPDRYRLTGNYCHDRWCTPCANERARTISRNVVDLAGTAQVRFVTLTLTACDAPLEEKLSRIRQSFVHLRRSGLWKRSVSAGIACLHVKRYENAPGWHVHYHVLVTGKYIPKVELSRAWHAITHDSKIVRVQFANDRRKVAAYMTQYAAKPLDMSFAADPDLLDEAVLALKGVRLVDTFGEWRGKPLTEIDDTGTWSPVCTLDDLLYSAHNHQPWALKILRTFNGRRVQDGLTVAALYEAPTYPRPPPTHVVTPNLFGDDFYTPLNP